MRMPCTLVVAVVVVTSCAPGGEPGAAGPIVPDGHPCPEMALPPGSSSLWASERDSGDPVPLTLLIPLEDGEAHVITQGNNQGPTHQGGTRWAWDMDAPVGTVVRAAAPGWVVWVRDDSVDHGEGEEHADDANWIVVDHGGGLFTGYYHLGAKSAAVAAGDPVAAGQPLGETGLSGQLTGPHLHFQVENVFDESLPARFVTPDPPLDCTRHPDTGDEVLRPREVAATLVGPDAPSALPPDAFAAYGVASLQGAPARLMERSRQYGLHGSVEPGATEVVVMLFPEGGGDAVHGFALDVVDGVFSGTLTLASVPPGRYGWAAVATAGEPPFAEKAIRVSVVD